MRRKNKKIRIINIFVIFLVLGGLVYLGYFIFNNKDNNSSSKNNGTKENTKKDDDKKNDPPKDVPKLKIIDLDSKTRPIGVMVDNETAAAPQAGLQDAYLVYEIIIEGGETRFFALFKDKENVVVGPNRSARHYFIDYALENDAIFTHFGFSDEAKADIKSLKIDDISGTEKDGAVFWRVAPKGSYHNVFTNTTMLMNRAKDKGYRVTSSEAPLLDYSISELDNSATTNAKVANLVRIYYSSVHYSSYEYDATNKVYKRYMRGKAHLDRTTGNQITVKNIIIYNVKNYDLNDGSGKGRQGLNNIGNGTGYYISDGYAIPITWSKTARASKTVYKDMAGNTLKVNDGNTFIQIQPLNKVLTIQ